MDLERRLNSDARNVIRGAAHRSYADTLRQVKRAQRHFRGSTTPVSAEEAGYLEYVKGSSERTLLRRFSLANGNYTRRLVGKIERRLSHHLLSKSPAEEAISDVAGIMRGDEWQAERIVRTETANAYERARYHTMREVARDEPEMRRQWLAILDFRTSEDCRALHMRSKKSPVGIREPFIIPSTGEKIMNPPLHPQCHLGSTPVRGSMVGGLIANYSGKVFEIKTRSGQTLSVTPHHPVLTADGMSAALYIRQGQNLIAYRGDVHLPTSRPHEIHKQESPSLAEDIFGSLRKKLPTFQCAPSGIDLHGDAVCVQSDIDIVGSDWELERASTQGGDLPFMLADMELLSIASLRDFDLHRFGNIAPPYSFPCSAQLPDNEFSIFLEGRPLQKFSLASSPDGNSTLDESENERRAGPPITVTDIFQRCPGAIFFDQVREVRDFSFRGHIYDFQSPWGWIVSSGIVVGNCRCTIVPWLPSED